MVGFDVYICRPAGTGWWSESGTGPNGEEGILYHGPNGEEVFMSWDKVHLCEDVCSCNYSGCTVDINQGPYNGNLDLSIDVDSGILIGTGSEGRVEAVKQ